MAGQLSPSTANAFAQQQAQQQQQQHQIQQLGSSSSTVALATVLEGKFCRWFQRSTDSLSRPCVSWQSPGNYSGAALITAFTAFNNATGRTVLPATASVDELLNLVHFLAPSSPSESSPRVGSTAGVFHADATIKKHSLHGQELKIGWGKPSPVRSPAVAINQSNASRNVYLGGFEEDTIEEQLRDDLSRFGLIDQVKIVRGKNSGFVHFLSISVATKANFSSYLPCIDQEACQLQKGPLRIYSQVKASGCAGGSGRSSSIPCGAIHGSYTQSNQHWCWRLWGVRALFAIHARGIRSYRERESDRVPWLLGLIADQVLPTALTVNNTSKHSQYRHRQLGRPAVRHLRGAVHELTASPFTDVFVFIAGLPLGVERVVVLPALNGEGANGRRELAEALAERYARGDVETRYRVFHPSSHAKLTCRFKACAGVSDDTLHTPLPFFGSPAFIGSTPPAGSNDTAIDLVFVDSIGSQVVQVPNGLQTAKTYTSTDIKSYMPTNTQHLDR
ncbi:hypothetical protein EDB84DRAFT_1678995 [Lactarius hengduanensis]|nr:hypothetical protein EDB84DRAFT_1678995 [Lactarius hengduanensis]